PMRRKEELGTKLKAADYRLRAARKMLAGMRQKSRVYDVQVKLVRDQLARCKLVAPNKGIVTSRYKNPGEILGAGIPVLEIGEIDTMYVDFFVTPDKLSELSDGAPVELRVDIPEQSRKSSPAAVPATVVWISEHGNVSSYNPARREGRKERVFRVRATAANNQGILNRGMPVDVRRRNGDES
ncbi:MAG: HlyD family efflux transporter periplasmic adaptor subunit, partial [Chitinivibrionales bacterium]|nr:HlyD family efflux transporter periplasmic adaptor subunit [Chitinivibrionales bacterium]